MVNPSHPHYVVALTRAIRIVCFHMNLLCRTMEIIRPLRPSHLHPGSAGPRSPLTCFSTPRPGLLFVPSLRRDQPNGFYIWTSSKEKHLQITLHIDLDTTQDFLGFKRHNIQHSDLSGSVNIECVVECVGHCITWKGSPLFCSSTAGFSRSLDPFAFGCFTKFCSTSLLLPLHRCSLFKDTLA